jgi:amino acid transporter
MTATTEPSAGVPSEAHEGKGLKDGAIGLLSNTVIATASVAPAYSLAAALVFVVGYVGLQSPAVMLLAFIPMAFVAVGYAQLNEQMPDCGTTFTWGTKAFGPKTGWMGGWAIIAADIIVMANLAAIAGGYIYLFVGHFMHSDWVTGLANNKWWTLLLGMIWIALMAFICYIGIEIAAAVQYGLLAVELTMLFILSITALSKVYGGSAGSQAIHPHWSWFDPFHATRTGFALGLLTAIFIYWGWDTAVSVNEETRDKHHAPGRAAILSTVLLLVTYVLVTTSAQAFAGIGDKGIGLNNADNSGDALSVLGDHVFGTKGGGWILTGLLILMVLSSAAASTLTTILPTARTSLSMAAYRSIPVRFARIHRKYLTPSWSTVGMAVASMGFYLLMTAISTNVLGDTISSLGLMIAFYYGLTGLACVWWFRRDLGKGIRHLILKGILPGLGAVILFFFFFYGAKQFWSKEYGSTSWTLPFSPHWQIGGVFLTGIGALVLGVILMFVYRFIAPPFFKGEILNRNSELLVLESDVDAGTWGRDQEGAGL